eukprot:8970432-Ditylum_brightwellii.AAC.1
MVLGLTYLKGLGTVNKVNVNPPTMGTNAVQRTQEALHSTILLPPWITKEIKAADASSFSKLFLLVCEKAHDQDCLVDAKQDGDNVIPSTTHCKDVLHILQLLWYWNYAANLPQQSVTCNLACHPAQSVETHTWCRDIHSWFICPHQGTSNITHPLAIDTTSLSHLIDNLNAMCTGSLLSSASLKKGTATLSPKTKVMMYNALSVDGLTPQPDLPTSLQNFLNPVTTVNLLEHLQDQLQQKNCICRITPGTSAENTHG